MYKVAFSKLWNVNISDLILLAMILALSGRL